MKIVALLIAAALSTACATAAPEVIAWSMPLAATQDVAALGPLGNVPAFTFPCTTSITRIKPPTSSAGYEAIQVWVNSATPVYFGDITVDSTGWPLCTAGASCPSATTSIDTRNLYCLSSSGTVTINAQVARP